ncbi:MAG: membrane-bound lytic murein transglycosylase MltF [Gammaproteobacteria bacterium]|nr:membrane-bound lytic murein transglycosylase MltF [Gammaproteobacteria bacterium]
MIEAPPQRQTSSLRTLVKLSAFLMLLSLAVGLAPLYLHFNHQTQLENVLERGELIVATINSASTYYEGRDGAQGFEYELALAFATFLNVKLKLVTASQFQDLFPMVSQGQVDLAAAGLTVSWTYKTALRFTTPYQEVRNQLIYRSGTPRPKNMADLSGKRGAVVKGSYHQLLLETLQVKQPTLQWQNNSSSQEELLNQVWDRELDFSVVNSNVLRLNQPYYPELRVAFELSRPQKLGWAFRRQTDDSLYNEAQQFFKQVKKSGLITQLQERYYGHIRTFDYVDTRRFMRHIKSRLPKYLTHFKKAAQQNKLDWRLLAAMSYQESHWRPNAVSPTGVKGLMMLTLKTASQMKVENRLDPEQSIFGGARYFAKQLQRIPDQVLNPDRVWMALASYNIGYGHLKDARRITTMLDEDSRQWVDVKNSLPLLRQRKWYKQVTYGYARGNEALHYVKNIRQYYDILVWITDKEKQQQERQKPQKSSQQEPSKKRDPIMPNIPSPL